MKKRLLSGIICLCLLLAMFPAIAPAASAEGNVIASGNCGGDWKGTNLTWTLTDDYTLTISGKGDMKNYGTDVRAPWYEYRKSMKTLVIESGVTSIGNCTFTYCSGFTGKLVIPEGVTSIGSHAFYGCQGFTGNLVIPDSVTTIYDSAFLGCSGLTGNLVIPDSVTSIGGFAFWCCSGFTGDLVIPDGMTSIDDGAFRDCEGLTGKLVMPDGVTYIGNYAFQGCRFTGNLVIPDNVTSIGDAAFSGCRFTGNLVIPDGVTSIGESAFLCCGFTGNLVIPASVTSIGDSAFGSCDGLSNIYFKGNAPAVSGNAEIIFTNSSFLTAVLYTIGGDYESVVDDHPGFTIYYLPGTTGWTDSEYYDAEAGTWLWTKLAVWNDGGIGVTDVTTADWFYSYVADMTKAGVVSGYPDGSFRPQGNVTWGEALKLVLKATGYGEFEAGTHWASGYMDKALAEGFMDHEVDLNSAITRGEMADLTAKAMKLAPSTNPNPFDDEVSSYAVALYEAEIITGSQDNGRLVYRADSTITRAEMAAIISRVYNK